MKEVFKLAAVLPDNTGVFQRGWRYRLEDSGYLLFIVHATRGATITSMITDSIEHTEELIWS